MKEITALESFQRIDEEDFLVLDVREQYEVDTASVENYIHIPMNQIPARLNEIPTDKTIAVLCHTGVRSGRVTQYLDQQGFNHVFNIVGGIEAWATTTPSSTPQYRKSNGVARTI